MSKLNDYIDLLWSQVGKGIYVYGGNGENLSAMTPDQRKEYMERRETETKNSKTGQVNYTKQQNIARCEALYKKRVAAGVNPILAFDCSGLQYWAGKQTGVIPNDLSANTLYGKCKPIEKKDVKRGDYCFAHNGKKATHVGMYVGDDIIIEAQGRDVGVVTNKLSRTTVFNRFGRYPAFEENPEPEPPKPEPPKPEPTPTKQFVVVNGKVVIQNGVKNAEKSVRIRNGNGTDYDTIAIAHSEDRFPLVKKEEKAPYWYQIVYNNRPAWISSKPEYTHIENGN